MDEKKIPKLHNHYGNHIDFFFKLVIYFKKETPKNILFYQSGSLAKGEERRQGRHFKVHKQTKSLLFFKLKQ